MNDRWQETRQTLAGTAELRKRSEAQVRVMESTSLAQTPEAIQQMFHDLRVDQIELEMQNVELRLAYAEIETSRARYFDIYDLTPVGHVTVSEKGLILGVNLTAAALLGMNRGALVKRRLTQFILKNDQGTYYHHRKQIFETGAPRMCELRLVKPDGALLWAQLDFSAEESPDGRVFCHVVLQNISERKQAEKILKESEFQYRNLANAGLALIWTSGTDKLCNYFNDPWLKFTGRTLEQEIGNGWTEGVHPDDFDRRLETSVTAFDKRAPFEMEYRLCHASGEYRIILDLGTPNFNSDGEFIGYIGHCFDISRRKQIEESLRESEEKYRVLFNAFPLGITISDPSGNIVESNARAAELLGIPKDVHEARRIDGSEWRIIRPDGTLMPAKEYPSVRALKENRLVDNVEMGIVKPEAEITWINVTAAPLLLENYGVVITYNDITAYRKAERDYKTLFREMLDGFALHEIICDASGEPADYRFLDINPAFERMTGLKRQDVLGKTVLQLLPGIERYWIETYGKVALTGEPALFANYSVELDKHFEVTAFRPAPNQFACIFADITESKRAENALRESEARFKALHNASFGGIAIHHKGIILECNQGLSAITGYSTDELIGMNFLLLISETTRDKVLNNIISGSEKPYETIGVRKNNEEYPLRSEARNIPYKGESVRVVELRDITEQKLVEAEKNNLEVQLSQAQKMESVGRLAGGVAHDFNNMLGVIRGYTEIALEQIDPAQPLFADLQEVYKAAERSSDLTRQLLTFARKQTIAPKVIDLNETVEEMLKMLRRLIGEDIELLWKPGKNLGPVKVDPSQIDQLLTNLCVNARDAISGVGKITIETAAASVCDAYCANHAEFVPGEYVLLAVSDNGCGMDKETLGHVFEPFFTTKEMGRGTGLGLASVYGMVKQNNGFINVYSEPGHGTTFKVYLSRVAVESAPRPEKAPGQLDENGHETILLVEDERAILRMTTMMLTRLGYTVVAAATPGEAIRLANEYNGRIDLIITDVVMPEMNGRELAENLSSHYPDLKLLFMSGYTASVIAHHGVLDEGVHFIQKPFSARDLAAKVRKALKK